MRHRARIAAALALAAFVAAAPATARACVFDDEPDPNFSIDTLNNYYPGGYKVFVRTMDARREGHFDRLIKAGASVDEQKERLIWVASAFESQLRQAAKARIAKGLGTPPPFSLLLLESMLWVRYHDTIATDPALIHAREPWPGDLVVIMGEDALTGIVTGKFDLLEAEKRGFLQYFGSGPAQARFHNAYDGVGTTPAKEAGR